MTNLKVRITDAMEQAVNPVALIFGMLLALPALAGPCDPLDSNPAADHRVDVDQVRLSETLPWSEEVGKLILQTSGTFTGQASEISSYPKFIYHWAEPEDSVALVTMLSAADKSSAKFFPLMVGSNIQIFPMLEKLSKGGVFGFHNVFAFQGGRDETYGSSLVRFTIKSGARILRLKTLGDSIYYQPYIKGEEFAKFAKLEDFDLVYIEGMSHEWVVLNPAIIESATADRTDLQPEVQTALTHLRNPSFSPPWIQTHFGFDSYVRPHGIRLFENILGRSAAAASPPAPKYEILSVDSQEDKIVDVIASSPSVTPLSEAQRARILEALSAEYGWAVPPNMIVAGFSFGPAAEYFYVKTMTFSSKVLRASDLQELVNLSGGHSVSLHTKIEALLKSRGL